MPNLSPRHHAVACLAAAVVLVAGCGSDSEQDLTASAKSELAKKEFSTAVIQLKAALQQYPKSGELRFLLGDTLLKTGDAGAAALELGKASDLRYDDNAVVPALAKALVASGQAKRATDTYSRFTLNDPKAAAELQVALAAGYAAQGMNEASDAAIQAALTHDPKNPTARLIAARSLAGHGQFDSALAEVDSLIADAGKTREALQLRGEILWMGRGDRDGAIKAFRDAIAMDSRWIAPHAALLAIHLQRNDAPALRASFAELKKALPNHSETKFYEAQLALLDKDYPRARELTQQLLRNGPDNPRLLQLAGAVETIGGSLVVAETHLSKALRGSPNLPFARRLLAEIYVRSGQPDRALTTLQPLLERRAPSAAALALAAEAHLLAGETGKAEQFFVRAAKADPGDAKLQTALALTAIARGRSEEGFANLETVAAHDATMYADLALVGARMRRNDWAGALKAVDRLQAKAPDKATPYHLRGRILAARGDSAGARESFEKALQVDPQFMPSTTSLAAMDIGENKPRQAQERYERLLAREPNNNQARLALAELRRSQGAPAAEVARLLEEAARANPNDPAPRARLVQHHLAQGDSTAALAAAQQAVAALPDEPQLIIALGQAQLAKNEVQQAISTFGRLAAMQPSDPRPLLLLADAYESTRDNKGAEGALRKALSLQPDRLAAQDRLVQLLIVDKRHDAALEIARTIQKQRPRAASGFLAESAVHADLKAWTPALAALRQGLEREPGSTIAARLHAMYVAAGQTAEAERFAGEWQRRHPRDPDFVAQLGNAAIAQQDWARAEAEFRRLLTLAPDDASAANNVAWLLVQQKKPGAVAFAQRANELAPDRPPIMDTLATALAAENQLAQAIEWQRKVVARAPADANYRIGLAKLLMRSGDNAGAKTALQDAAKLEKRPEVQAQVASLMKSL